jgi:hypothetical protein
MPRRKSLALLSEPATAALPQPRNLHAARIDVEVPSSGAAGLSAMKPLTATGQTDAESMQGTADVSHPIAAAYLPSVAAVFDAATALATAMDMVDPSPTLVERLVRLVLLPRALLPQIEIKSIQRSRGAQQPLRNVTDLCALRPSHVATSRRSSGTT